MSPVNWSGTPNGLCSGLADHGVELVPITVKFPPVLREAVALAGRWSRHRGAVVDRSVLLREFRNRALARNLRRAGRLDAVLAMGTEMYDLHSVVPRGLRTFTYDDATLAQMWQHRYSDLRQSDFPLKNVHAWIRYQRESSRRADGCFVSTSWAAESFEQDYGVDRRRIRVVGIGHRQRAGALVQRDWKQPRFLFVGLDWDRKNGAAVVESFRRVRSTVPDARLDLVGGIPSISLPGIVSHGVLPLDDIRAQRTLDSLYASATCFVLPSRFEPAGIAYLEAASAGLPVITTNQGGATQLLRAGALAVDPDNIDAIERAMRKMADGSVAERMGALAVQAAAGSTWEDVAARILAGIASAAEGLPSRSIR
jgi:glycosyltransferase involved in cell wall biosynthesis